MKTIEQLREARDALRAHVGERQWVRGFGIGDQTVRLNVRAVDDEVRAVVPAEINGVPVEVVAVGDIVAL